MELKSVVKSHFLNLFSIALSDMEVDTTELELLYHIGEDRGVPKEEIEYLIMHPNKVNFHIPEETVKKVEYLYDFALMIYADGKVEQYEEEALERFIKAFGFLDENISELKSLLLSKAKENTSRDEFIQEVKKTI